MVQTHEERATAPAPDTQPDIDTPKVAEVDTPFKNPGDKVVGIITRPPAIGQYYDQRCVTLTVTNQGRDTVLYVTGSLRGAFLKALQRAGVTRPEVGGRLWVCFIRHGVQRSAEYRPKILAASYTPPGVVPTYPSRKQHRGAV